MDPRDIVVSFNKERCPRCGKKLNEREIKLKKCTKCKCNINFMRPATPIISGIVLVGCFIGMMHDEEAKNMLLGILLLIIISSCITAGFKFYVKFIRECTQWLFGTGKYSNPKDKKWFKW